jgi:hypothetical protein
MKSHLIAALVLSLFSSPGLAAPWDRKKEEKSDSLTAAEHRALEASVVDRLEAISRYANESFELIAGIPFERDSEGNPTAKIFGAEDLDKVSETLMRSQIEVMALKELVTSKLQLLESKRKRRQGARPDGMYNRAHLKNLKSDDLIDDSELADL